MVFFVQEKLQQVIVMDSPDVFVIANDPESGEDEIILFGAIMLFDLTT